jgi:hypothetical protein
VQGVRLSVSFGPHHAAYECRSVLINVVLVCYYVSLKQRPSTLLQSDAQLPSLDASLPRARVTAAKGSPPSRKSELAYDATVKAEVDTRLMEGLAEANELQVHRLVKRQQALRAADPVLTKPTTSKGNLRLPSQEPEHQEYQAQWEWGSINPENGMQRLTCSDSAHIRKSNLP